VARNAIEHSFLAHPDKADLLDEFDQVKQSYFEE
jgi:hypothetical protein